MKKNYLGPRRQVRHLGRSSSSSQSSCPCPSFPHCSRPWFRSARCGPRTCCSRVSSWPRGSLESTLRATACRAGGRCQIILASWCLPLSSYDASTRDPPCEQSLAGMGQILGRPSWLWAIWHCFVSPSSCRPRPPSCSFICCRSLVGQPPIPRPLAPITHPASSRSQRWWLVLVRGGLLVGVSPPRCSPLPPCE
jgi:hypothetical protein